MLLSRFKRIENIIPLKYSTTHFNQFHSTMSSFSTLFPVDWKDDVSSTMDVAKERIISGEAPSIFAIVAKHQTKGRGTHGREWKSSTGNLYMSLSFDRKLLPVACPLMLTPLKVGTLLVPIIACMVNPACNVALKWPNDVLIDGAKVCGVLIEMEHDHFVVGVGCNINSSPEIVRTGAEGARPATHVLRHRLATAGSGSEDAGGAEACRTEVAEGIIAAFGDWLCPPVARMETAADVVAAANVHLSQEPQAVRLDGVAEGQDAGGRWVQPLRVNADGTLQVRDEASGAEETLITDYLL